MLTLVKADMSLQLDISIQFVAYYGLNAVGVAYSRRELHLIWAQRYRTKDIKIYPRIWSIANESTSIQRRILSALNIRIIKLVLANFKFYYVVLWKRFISHIQIKFLGYYWFSVETYVLYPIQTHWSGGILEHLDLIRRTRS